MKHYWVVDRGTIQEHRGRQRSEEEGSLAVADGFAVQWLVEDRTWPPSRKAGP